MRLTLTSAFLVLGTLLGWSQVTVTGRILEEETGLGVSQAQVVVRDADVIASTDEDGVFELSGAIPVNFTLVISVEGLPVERAFTRNSDQVVLGEVVIPRRINYTPDLIPTISLSDDDAFDEGENISGVLSATRDVFQSTAAFVFGPARFRVRGYDSENNRMYLNGLPFNDLEVGRVYWSNWGGLNDATRNQETYIGLVNSDFAFGGVGGSSAIDLRASAQRAQKKFTYSLTNRNYRNRLMAIWSSGMSPAGWAVSVSASRRWAEEGYIDGTFYDAYAYYFSVDRKLGDAHSLNLVALGSPTKRGRNGAATQEMYDLAGSNYYNPYWGYQNREKRNSRVADAHQPIVNLRHDWTFNENSVLTTSIGYQTGKNASGALDWFNANDPRPDYYRRLPSYYDDPELQERIRGALISNESLRQVQWDKLYEVNRVSMVTIDDVDGIEGNDITGRLSQYIVEQRRYDNSRIIGASNLQHVINDMLGLYAGIHYSQQRVDNYKLVDDLLGGEFYVDFDKYAQLDFPNDSEARQNDLNRPNRLVHEGERFGYDYEEHIRDYGAWAQLVWTLPKIDIFTAASLDQNSFWRVGNVRNGKFPDSSFGESEKQDFTTYGVKGGATYKFDGRNYISVNGIYTTRPPVMRNALVSPRTRNQFVAALTEETIYGGEASYRYTAPYFKARLTGYYTQFEDQVLSRSFYHDDERSFVNFTMTGIDKEHMGIEAAAEVTVVPGLQVHGVAAVGQYIYNSRPVATVSQDNNADLLEKDLLIYAKNFYVSGTPQSAYTFGISYRSKNYWSAYVNLNYLDDVWIEYNPVRRTTDAIDLVEEGSDQWNAIIHQEKGSSAFTVNATLFKSFLIDSFKENVYINLSLSVNNALDNQDFITGGYEQLRFDFEEKDPGAFPSRYYYFQGLNYYFNASIRF